MADRVSLLAFHQVLACAISDRPSAISGLACALSDQPSAISDLACAIGHLPYAISEPM